MLLKNDVFLNIRKDSIPTMQSYSSKEALIQAIEINYKKYIDEFINIPNELKNTRVDKVFHIN